jgi:hypothetical protein
VKALHVALAHLEIGQQMMGEAYRLCHLQVGEAGHDGVGVMLRKVEQRRLQRLEQGGDIVDRTAQIQADVGCHLIVARTAGVQALSGIAHQRGEALLYVQMHVFQVDLPDEIAADDFVLDLGEAALDVFQILCADDFAVCKHPRVSQ